MSIADINALRDDLLVELADRGAKNGNPGNVAEICAQLRPDIDWQSNRELARSAGWLLVKSAPPLAKTVVDSERPGAMLLALTAAGKAAASEIFVSKQPLTTTQKLKAVSRNDWIAIVALIVAIVSAAASAFSTYIAYLALEAK